MTATLVPTLVPSSLDRALDSVSGVASVRGGPLGVQVSRGIERARRSAHAVWIVLIIAIAIVIVVGVLAWAMAYCVARGGSFAGGLSFKTNGWRVWEYRIQFLCTR
jgi:hypothetical protein